MVMLLIGTSYFLQQNLFTIILLMELLVVASLRLLWVFNLEKSIDLIHLPPSSRSSSKAEIFAIHIREIYDDV